MSIANDHITPALVAILAAATLVIIPPDAILESGGPAIFQFHQ